MIRKRGFTLIELVIVITIIGLLATVVLASMGPARKKSRDASIKENMHGVQTQAELYYYLHNNSYGPAGTQGACLAAGGASGVFVDPTVTKQIAAVENVNGASAGLTCRNSTNAYAVSSVLVEDVNYYWCVDSSGKASKSQTPLTSGTSCPS